MNAGLGRHLLTTQSLTKVIVIGLLAIAVMVGVAIAAAPAAPASAGATDPQVAVLVKQVRLLQAQVKKLKTENVQKWNDLGAGWDSQNCLGAQMADLIQGTWGVIDVIGQAQATPTMYFGAQSQVPDYGTCESFSQPAVPRVGIQSRPTIDPLLPLLQWIHG